MARLNLFDIGNLDIESSLPNITDEDNVEVTYQVESADDEASLIERNMDKEFQGLEDAQDVLEEMKDIIVRHEANVQSMNGQEVGGQATDSQGQVVAEVPAEQQPEVDQNSSNEEVAQQNADLQTGNESICGAFFGKSAEEVYRILKIDNPYVGYQSGLNSLQGSSVRVAYEEGLLGVKELAGKIWFKVKATIQSILQWLSKWIHKAVIAIKNYESKAKSLKEQAQKLNDGSKAKTDFKFSQLTMLLVKDNSISKSIKEIYTDIKNVSSDNGLAVKFIHELVENLKSTSSSSDQNNNNDNKQNDNNQPQAGNNDGNAGNNQQANNQAQGETAKQILDKALQGFSQNGFSKLLKFADSEGNKSDFYNHWIVYGINNINTIGYLKIEYNSSKLGSDYKFEKTSFFKNVPPESEINGVITGKMAKDITLSVCDSILQNISEIKSTLDKGNSAVNKIRNEVFNTNASESFASGLGRTVIQWSKFSQKALISAAYTPGYFLSACSELVRSIEGGSSDSNSSNDDNKQKDGNKQ